MTLHLRAPVRTPRRPARCARPGSGRLVAVVCLVLMSGGCSIGGDADPARPTAARPAPTAVASSATSQPRAGRESTPRSMAALGDSITRAFASCSDGGDCPQSSWSTGTAAGLMSHAQRIRHFGGRLPEVHNLAVSGATVSGLMSQASDAVAADVDYVTVLIGGNDACASSEQSMTPVREFRQAFDEALAVLARGLPDARVLVVSIPDLARLWQVGKDHDEVVAIWQQYGICQSMLAQARSTDPQVQARRDRVRARVAAYNAGMAAACAKHRNCRSDGGAVFDYDFSLDMVSRADFWHPSLQGQRTLAEVAWRAGYWG